MPNSNRGTRTAALDWAWLLFGILLIVFLAWGVGWLQAREKYERGESAAAYEAAAEKDAERSCIGTNPSAVFECVNEKHETAYQTYHDEQDLSAQQRAASSALASTVLSFIALVLSGFGVWYVKRTLDATLDAVEDTNSATQAMLRANEIAESEIRPLAIFDKFQIEQHPHDCSIWPIYRCASERPLQIVSMTVTQKRTRRPAPIYMHGDGRNVTDRETEIVGKVYSKGEKIRGPEFRIVSRQMQANYISVECEIIYKSPISTDQGRTYKTVTTGNVVAIINQVIASSGDIMQVAGQDYIGDISACEINGYSVINIKPAAEMT